MKIRFILFVATISLSACAHRDGTSLPIRDVATASGTTSYLELPNSSTLLIRRDGKNPNSPVKSISYSSNRNTLLTEDYSNRELFVSTPPFEDFTLWNIDSDGHYTRASSEEHEKLRKSFKVIESLVEEVFKEGTDSDEAINQLKAARETLRRIKNGEG